MNIFLSASVPLPDRHPIFFESADVISIREAVKALAISVPAYATITFGGHPAITPLIALTLREQSPEKAKRFILYQSAHFLSQFPAENDEFTTLRITEDVEGDRNKSLQHMRREMFTFMRFDYAIFIGGMEGILEEFELIKEMQPHVVCLPIASTGGGSLHLYEKGEYDNILLDEITYPTLFRKILNIEL